MPHKSVCSYAPPLARGRQVMGVQNRLSISQDLTDQPTACGTRISCSHPRTNSGCDCTRNASKRSAWSWQRTYERTLSCQNRPTTTLNLCIFLAARRALLVGVVVAGIGPLHMVFGRGGRRVACPAGLHGVKRVNASRMLARPGALVALLGGPGAFVALLGGPGALVALLGGPGK